MILTTLFISNVALAQAPKKIDIPANNINGQAYLIHEVPGEPIGAPERLRVMVKCKKEKAPREIALFRMCELGKFDYETGTKMLEINLVSGRVEIHSGEVKCDQADQKQIDLSAVCK